MSIICTRLSKKTNPGRVRGIRLVWVPGHEVGMRVHKAVQLLLLTAPDPEGRRWIGTRPQAPRPTWRPGGSFTTPERAYAALERLWRVHEL